LGLLPDGARITDTLVVDRQLGEGAYAEVYRVRHEYLGWQAMKLFERVTSLDETQTLLNEARLLSAGQRPGRLRRCRHAGADQRLRIGHPH
jgi:eukaryotic-like serine/threonine-protein kinase